MAWYEKPSTFLAVVAIAALLVFAVVYYAQLAVTPPPAPEVIEPYVGQVSAYVYTQSSFKPETLTGITAKWYRMIDTTYSYMGSGNMTLQLTKQDNGVVVIVPESSTAYIDDQLVLDGLAWASATLSYADVDNDGYLEHAFKMTLTEENIFAPTGQTPVMNVFIYGVPYDSSISLNSPSDVSGIGTGLKTVYVTWKLVWSDTDKGVKIGKIEIATNATDSQLKVIQLSSVLGTYSSDAMSFSTSDKTWTVDIGVTKVLEPYGILLKYAEGDNPDFAYFTFKFETNFSTEDAFYVTLKITIIEPDGSKTTLTDTVNLIKS